MKWPSLDESVSLCICLLTVASNREMQHIFLLAFRCGGKKVFGFGSGSGSIKDIPFIANHVTDQMSINLISC